MRGAMFLEGAAVPTQIESTPRAVALGIGLLTEDRKSQGLLRGRAITENVTLADLATCQSSRLDRAQPMKTEVVARWTRALRIRARDGAQDVDELSGGNQQKVLLARWLHRDCRVLLLDEPTRGVDVGARADIYTELEALAAAGKALIVVSSDLTELMALCDRIAVMSAGQLVQIFARGEWSESRLLAAAFAGHEGHVSTYRSQGGTEHHMRTASLGLPLALIALIVGFGVSSDYFFSRDTFMAIANDIPALLVMAVGMTFVLIIAGIDLSVGSVLALAGGLTAVAIVGWHWPVPLAAVLGLACGVLCGALTGLIALHGGCRPSSCRWVCSRLHAAVLT